MKTVLKFNEDERDQAVLAMHGADFYSVLFNFDQQLRSWWKHGNDFENVEDCLEKSREYLRELMDSRGITFEIVS